MDTALYRPQADQAFLDTAAINVAPEVEADAPRADADLAAYLFA